MPEIILLELEKSLNDSIFGKVYPIYSISRMMKAGWNKFRSAVENLWKQWVRKVSHQPRGRKEERAD